MLRIIALEGSMANVEESSEVIIASGHRYPFRPEQTKDWVDFLVLWRANTRCSRQGCARKSRGFIGREGEFEGFWGMPASPGG
jgi:hypothetical protein